MKYYTKSKEISAFRRHVGTSYPDWVLGLALDGRITRNMDGTWIQSGKHVIINVGDWIVLIDNNLHIYKDTDFRDAFEARPDPAPLVTDKPIYRDTM